MSDYCSEHICALGNRNPDFIPSDEVTRQYFELMDKVGQELPDALAAADAYLWCAAVSHDIDILTDLDGMIESNFFLTTLYPNLMMNISHTFCDMYVNLEALNKSKGIFEALRRTMGERIPMVEWSRFDTLTETAYSDIDISTNVWHFFISSPVTNLFPSLPSRKAVHTIFSSLHSSMSHHSLYWTPSLVHLKQSTSPAT